jgi:hypothetical protein
MSDMPSLETQIAEMNARLRELEAKQPIPASVPAKPKRLPEYSQLIDALYVRDFVGGSERRIDYMRPYSEKAALIEANARAKKRGCTVKFIDWQTPVNRETVGCQDAVMVVWEVSASTAGSGAPPAIIREWPFAQPLPEFLKHNEVKS